MNPLLRPADLDQIATDAEVAKMDAENKLKKKKEQQGLDLREAFMQRDIHPAVFERLNQAVKTAAEQGAHQLQIITFPSTYCTDRGRRINIADPEWPSTLQGFAKKAYEFYDKELRPLGYKLQAEIISYPGGMPGDVGLFLKW